MKAYIFTRGDEGCAFVGSSNISESALKTGLEWNLRVNKNENPSRYVEDDTNTNYFKSSYNLVANFKNEPLGIIYIPYFADDTTSKQELTGFLIRLGFVHGNMILIAFVIAYFISNFVTKSLDSIGETIKKTNLQNQNVKINIDNTQ